MSTTQFTPPIPWTKGLVKDSLCHLELMAEDCAVIARGLMLAEENARRDDPGELIRAYRLAFQALTVALAYQTNVDKGSEARTQEHLQQLWLPKAGDNERD